MQKAIQNYVCKTIQQKNLKRIRNLFFLLATYQVEFKFFYRNQFYLNL